MMRFSKIIGLFLLFSLFSFQSLYAQTPKKRTTKNKAKTSVKSVPASTKNKTALKKITTKAASARKQQIKKAVRRSKISRPPIRRR
jgi:hypothetical protein